jgi:hypothetical protein
MGWVRVSDDFYDHPKFAEIGPLGMAMWITGLAYCNRNLTNGLIPKSAARRFVDFDGIAYTVATVGDLGGVMEDDCMPLALHLLFTANLWHEQGHDCDTCPQPPPTKYIIHDYLDYQPSAAEVRRLAADRKKAGRKGARARWGGLQSVSGE